MYMKRDTGENLLSGDPKLLSIAWSSTTLGGNLSVYREGYK